MIHSKRTFSRSREELAEDDSSARLPELPGWKRVIDVGLIVLASPLWFPLTLFIALLIKLVSAGPALFRQERVGYLGRRFTCLKFRTMRVNADPRVHEGHLNRLMNSNLPMQKLDSAGDPRVIPCGRWLRSLGLDELPQLFNVLRGEMSLVGPRPCLPYEYESYTVRHRQRFEAVPGLTGLWQVSGKNRTTFEQMIALDIFYAGHQSPWLDLKILFKTIPAVILQSRELGEEDKRSYQTGRQGSADEAVVNFPETSQANNLYQEQL